MTNVTTTQPAHAADEHAVVLATLILQVCGFTVTK
jgi:hypothetical protein